MIESRANGLFKDVSDNEWNDWKWQVRNRVETLEDLKNTSNSQKKKNRS